MKRLVIVTAILAALAAMPVWAGHAGDPASMQAMKAEFGKCLMCKHFVPVFDELMPVLQTQFVQLDNGMAMVHTVTDPSKVKLMHDVAAKMGCQRPGSEPRQSRIRRFGASIPGFACWQKRNSPGRVGLLVKSCARWAKLSQRNLVIAYA